MQLRPTWPPAAVVFEREETLYDEAKNRGWTASAASRTSSAARTRKKADPRKESPRQDQYTLNNPCRSVDAADAPIIAPVDAVSAVATRTISAITIAPMHPDCPVRSSAASAIGAASTDDSVCLGNLDGQQAQDQQARCNELHGSSSRRDTYGVLWV
jgi:hypothetical protein